MALTRERDTPRREAHVFSYPVAANALILKGALVVLAAGFAAPGSTATGLITAGRAEETVDNRGGAAGAVRATVRRGVLLLTNLPADAVTGADRGADCFVVDDETVARTNGGGTRSRAGRVIDLEGGGVWVEVA